MNRGLSFSLISKLSLRYLLILVVTSLGVYLLSYEVLKASHVNELTDLGEYVKTREFGVFNRSSKLLEDFSISFNDDIQHAVGINSELFTELSDGSYRKQYESQNSFLEAGVYVDDSVNLTDELKRKITFIHKRVSFFGTAWRSQLSNLYFLGRENYVIEFLPAVDWYFNVDVDYEVSEQIYYQIAEPKNNPYREARWTPWYLDVKSGEWVFSVVFPIYVDGRFLGIVGTDILLRDLSNILQSGSYRNTEILLINPTQGILDEESVELPSSVLEQAQKLQNEVVFEQDGYFYYSSTISGPEWQLVLVSNGDDISVLSARIAFVLLIMGAVGFLLVSIMIFFLLRRMVLQPLHSLAFSFDLIGAGKRSSIPELSEENEISELFAAFGRMSDKLTEQSDEMKIQRQRLEQMINASTFVAIIETDIDGTIRMFNSGAERLLGYKASELVGTCTPERFHVLSEVEERGEELSSYYGRLIKGFDVFIEKSKMGEYEERQWTYVHKNGTHIPVNLVVTAVHNQYGEINGFLGIAVDISSLKLVEEELRNSHTALKSIIDSIPLAVVGLDAYSGIVMWSKGAEKIFGLKARDAERRRVSDILPLPENAVARIAEAAKEPFSIPRLYLEDRQLYLRVSGLPIENAGLVKSIVIFDDISSDVQMEKFLIQNEKIMSVGGIAAGVAHEINNPLSVVLQSIGSIERRLLHSNNKNLDAAEKVGLNLETLQLYLHQRDIVSLISLVKSSGERAASIVENMLQFSRNSGQKQRLVDPVLLIEETIELAASDYSLRKNYDFKKIKIEKKYADSVPEVECRKGEIQQVLLNLFTNAAQAMFSLKEPLIRIELEKRGEALFIGVRDSGPGIPANLIDKIFQPFFTTKGETVGTGLGLSVSKMIIEQNHKGVIEVENYGGAYFKILLPLKSS